MSLVTLSVVVVVGLIWLLTPSAEPTAPPPPSPAATDSAADRTPTADAALFVYCAAGLRYPIEKIADAYRAEYGVEIQLQYGGSNTLLNQLEVSRTGDLFIAAENEYIELAAEKQLVEETFVLASQRPVVVARPGFTGQLEKLADLARPEVRLALADADAAAVGKVFRTLAAAAGLWDQLHAHATRQGVFKPTVNEVATAVQIGNVDAGVVWDSTARQFPTLTVIELPELATGRSEVTAGVTRFTSQPPAALKFARYLAAADKGQQHFQAQGFSVTTGDPWEEKPELTLFAGAVNRNALDPVIREFERREGVRVNAVFNGCGILTAQMKSLSDSAAAGFPDLFMACDIYYQDVVHEWFQEAVEVSDTDIVMVVQAGNPRGIRQLRDLLTPGLRVVLGHPDQCTIGILSRRLLDDAGVYEPLRASGNVVNEVTSSALLVPNVVTGSADVALAYRTDTLHELKRIEAVDISSALAKAIQPVSVARSTKQLQLSRRLLRKITQSRRAFETQGFHWRADGAPPPSAPPTTPVAPTAPAAAAAPSQGD